MIRDVQIPPTGFGPGSQPSETEGSELEYMSLPQDMRTYTPSIPMVEADPALAPAMALMGQIADAADKVAKGGKSVSFDLSGLDKANRGLIAETMGEGEVAMKLRGIPALSVQESVFAGIWTVTGVGIDRIDVATVPDAARDHAFVASVERRAVQAGPGVVNAPALIAELEDKSAGYAGELHVINLTLLPHTEEDLLWLDTRLGQGATDILSRGYGNCRIRATALPHVWRVQFFNSMDTLILDTLEVTDMPEVVLAADEDLAESAARLRQVMEAIR
ncbi:hydrogenase expression/formation protein [Cognatiyoonia sp. IB215182]|uniref:hydrogenase expression/formation protein n=1 Tax=Cognatiyoonia sp. IB215182 TaxID=3097353 RepID=UPI002A12C033|nr:hydrogenase expression/formation protein [Cognatiyoonia sp. IB215182]MDX8355476.1 hydrogenase expression/formation protein [Cognatiyoonia sp. IB215182]